MIIKVLFVALVIASILAGVLSAASEAWPPNPSSNSQPYQHQKEANSPSR